MIVRIKPLDVRRGIKRKTHTYKSNTFREGAGWYEVSEVLGNYLKTVRQDEGNPESPLVFDTFETKAQAKAFEESEKKKLQMKAEVEDAIKIHHVSSDDVKRVAKPAKREGVVTTADLHGDEEPPVFETETKEKTVLDPDPDGVELAEGEEPTIDLDAEDGETDPPATAAVPGAPGGPKGKKGPKPRG